MATHSSTLAYKIPWMEEPGGLQSMGSLRVGQDPFIVSMSWSLLSLEATEAFMRLSRFIMFPYG